MVFALILLLFVSTAEQVTSGEVPAHVVFVQEGKEKAPTLTTKPAHQLSLVTPRAASSVLLLLDVKLAQVAQVLV